MRMTGNRLAALVAMLALPCFTPPSARAAWPHDPNLNVALSRVAGYEGNPRIVSDGAGGAIVCWQDRRSDPELGDIYVQRVDAAGMPRWTSNGVAVCTDPYDQADAWIASDGAGGAIIVWDDSRDDPDNYDLYAQRVDAAGVPQWAPNGIALCTAPEHQFINAIVSDGAGGAIVVWEDYRNGTSDIYVRRVSASGTPLWTANGVALCTAVNDQYAPTIASDGAGGAIVAWDDYRTGISDIYGRRVDAAGTPLWTANGVPLCAAANGQDGSAITSDGAGGAIVTWYDSRTNPSTADIYAQRVGAAGAPQWTTNGVAVCTAASIQTVPAIASDGAGGAIVTWNDYRSGASDVYVQRVSAAGTPQWTSNGVALCTAVDNQGVIAITSDGAGGAIVNWEDRRAGTGIRDIYAQRANAAGAPQWTANGVAICIAGGDQYLGTMISDGGGGAIVTWRDQRGVDIDVYAQRIERIGQLGNPEPVSAGVRDVPNDQGGKVRVSWYASYLDRESNPNLSAYDVYRSAPGSMATRAVQAGARRLTGFGDVPRSGERAFVVEPRSARLYAWEYLATISPAHFLETYGYLAATTSDSVAGSNPPTIFMVVGRNANGSMYWLSAPDSGYSVDNLPPAVPTALSGEYRAGTTTLSWGASAEPDFDFYELYRGTSPSFVPGLGNLLVSQPGAGYADAAGQPYHYKLSAVDVHGNRSGFALLTPPGTVDVVGKGPPARLSLSPAQPNPVVRETEFRFALPRAGPVKLKLFDAQGRQVRELANGWLPAGEHSARWDGRDGAGRRVPSGLYICRLEADGRTVTRRLAAIQ